MTTKTRSQLGSRQGKFSDHKPLPPGGGGGNFAKIEGQHDELQIGDQIWLHFPSVMFKQKLWDRELEVVRDFEYPWLQYTSHFSQRGSMYCTSGPYRDKPCWPCAFRAVHYEAGGDFKTAPYGASTRYALPLVIAETVYDAPLIDRKTNQVIKSRKTKQAITRFMAESYLEVDHPAHNAANLPSKYGHKAWISLSSVHLEMLRGIASKLADRCRGCAQPLTAKSYSCMSCFTGEQPMGKTIFGDGPLDAFRTQRKSSCANCSARNTEEAVVLEPETYCANPECGIENPQGDFNDFEILVTRTAQGEKNWSLDVLDVRLLGSEAPNRDEYMALVSQPLDLERIFISGYTLKDQEFKIPAEKRQGLDPSYGAKVKGEDKSAHDDNDTDDDNIPY